MSQLAFTLSRLGAIVIVMFSVAAAAQSPTGDFNRLELVVGDAASAPATDLKAPAEADARLVREFAVQRDDGHAIASLISAGDRLQLRLPRVPPLTLPTRLETLVSRDGRTVLQYGDDLIRMHPQRTDLFWVDDSGDIRAQVRNTYGGEAAVDMADDGHVAVAAPDYFLSHKHEQLLEHTHAVQQETLVDLYDPQGRKLLGGRLPKVRKVSMLRAIAGGGGVLLVSASASKPLEDNRLAVVRARGTLNDIPHSFGIVQKISVLEGASRAFVQGTLAYGVIDLQQLRVLWQRAGKIRQISPYGAAIDTVRQRLYVMTGISVDAATQSYRWTLSVFGAENGTPLGQATLPQPYRSTPLPVFVDFKADSIGVLADGRVRTVRVLDRRSAP
jgi:hypothetical protein